MADDLGFGSWLPERKAPDILSGTPPLGPQRTRINNRSGPISRVGGESDS